jgi:hypothetical protein
VSKYKNVSTTMDGRRFSSLREAAHYQDLLLAQRSGDCLFHLWQVPFHLPGGVRYVVDFVEFWKDGTTRFVDVKGYKTEVYKVKKKMVEAIYPIKILEA